MRATRTKSHYYEPRMGDTRGSTRQSKAPNTYRAEDTQRQQDSGTDGAPPTAIYANFRPDTQFATTELHQQQQERYGGSCGTSSRSHGRRQFASTELHQQRHATCTSAAAHQQRHPSAATLAAAGDISGTRYQLRHQGSTRQQLRHPSTI